MPVEESYEDRKPPGTLSGEECVALILSRCSRYIDLDQWRAIAKRRGVRRVAGSRVFFAASGGVARSAPLWCYVERDLRKQLSWLRKVDDRQLDIVDPAELPTVQEIYREARLLRDMRDLTSGKVDSSDEDDTLDWITPTINDLGGER